MATASKPSRRARCDSRSNFRWRLHSMQGFGVVPVRCASTYGFTTWASKSSEKLNTKWSIRNCWATRLASSTSLTEQQPVSLSPPHKRMVTPTTSWPSRRSSAAATDESTPPDIATSTFIDTKTIAGDEDVERCARLRQWQSLHRARSLCAPN